MQIGIVGAGALGLLCSSYLSKHHSVTLYVRRIEQQNIINEEQIKLNIKGEERFTTTNVTTKLTEKLEEADCLIISVKQSGIQQVMEQLNGLKHKTPLIFLQNGMGHLEALRVNKHPTYIGIVQHGAVKESDTIVNHVGLGVIKLAAVTGTNESIESILNQLHTNDFPFEIENEWEEVIKEKLIVNAVINPLTALFNVKNKSVIDNQHIRSIAINLCAEAALVLGINQAKAWKLVEEVAHNTGENTSSMRADIQQGRQTEIEAISGYILKQGNQPLPYTTFIYEAIVGIEQEAET